MLSCAITLQVDTNVLIATLFERRHKTFPFRGTGQDANVFDSDLDARQGAEISNAKLFDTHIPNCVFRGLNPGEILHVDLTSVGNTRSQAGEGRFVPGRKSHLPR